MTNNNTVTVDNTPYSFGTAQGDKERTTDNAVIYNPKLDWEMRWEDNTMPGKGAGSPSGNGDNNDSGQYHKDTATNWNESPDGYKYYWTGTADKSNIIIAAKVRTDDGYSDAYKQGLIGTENAYGGKTFFNMNTNSDRADYIKSEGIVGNVHISTQGGDDTIITKYLNGKYWVSKADFNGTETISMGDGNDIFEVNGSAASTGYGTTLADNAAFYMTNAKIDMGAGNDIVKITGGQITAGRENESGNYFLLGSGDDVMETKTITSEKDNYLASNIINLGSGHDTLKVDGDIMSHEDGVYNSQSVSDAEDMQARFLLMSSDSSDVHITGNVGGKVTMLMGSGNDTIRIDKELRMSGQANAMDWLSYTLDQNEAVGDPGFYNNENGYNIRGDINNALANGVSASGATGLGATTLTNQNGVPLADDSAIADISARIDLGNGNNTFTVGGGVTNANILGGIDKDVIKLAFDANGQPNGSTWVYNTKVWTGNGDDLVMMSKVTGSVKVYTGADSDDIQLYGVEGTNNEVHAGDGNDIIRLYGKVNGNSSNIFDGGDGYDTVIIGTAEDGAQSGFSIGGVDTTRNDHSQLWHIEEIQFGSNTATSKDWVRITDNTRISDTGELFIRDADGLNVSNNQVDLSATNWTAATKQTFSGHGDGITYNVYTNSANADAGTLYIQQDIQVLI
ncbi:hypothetical protein QV07_09585 [Gallibacterium genomosp. 3]|uniref:Uncharacterized protein n=1 Tax=Gallibacterium genomosp. 3 TaxID=505345 RepID=A0A1A7PW76_9PAST|nr:hypothetical protein QV07_09585 [Gallibacterium genomosp. 3]